MNYRHECKFYVNSADLELIRKRICYLIHKDSHYLGDSGYVVTSLYFDDINNRCWYENIQGYDCRHKYRIRIYDNDPSLIKLERKSKYHGLGLKIAATIDQNECSCFMDNRIPEIQMADPVYKKQLLCDMKLAGMLPKCIVQYDREAYTYSAGNVRITFDKNVRGSICYQDFLKKDIYTVPLLEQDQHILEVKYDAFLPHFISQALEIERLSQTSVSKYALSRNLLG